MIQKKATEFIAARNWNRIPFGTPHPLLWARVLDRLNHWLSAIKRKHHRITRPVHVLSLWLFQHAGSSPVCHSANSAPLPPVNSAGFRTSRHPIWRWPSTSLDMGWLNPNKPFTTPPPNVQIVRHVDVSGRSPGGLFLRNHVQNEKYFLLMRYLQFDTIKQTLPDAWIQPPPSTWTVSLLRKNANTYCSHSVARRRDGTDRGRCSGLDKIFAF
jgi:hypothetical protein